METGSVAGDPGSSPGWAVNSFSLILSEVEGRGGLSGTSQKPGPLSFDFAQDEGLLASCPRLPRS